MTSILQNLVRRSSRLAGKLWLSANRLALPRTPQDEVEIWARGLNVFFILGVGRSGSMFVAHLLDQAKESIVCHEPIRTDFAAYTEAFCDERTALDYVCRFRKTEIYLRIRNKNLQTYGEVNTNLRRHCNALRQAFPNLTLFHLVRDGREVVRSMMSRRTFQPWDPVTSQIYPQNEEDEWAKAWPQMSRFEKTCWYWMTENRHLRCNIGKTMQLEKLIANYSYFASQLLVPLGLAIPRRAWDAAKQRPKNVTKQYHLPHWSNWDNEKRQAFEKICGVEMHKNDYTIDWTNNVD